MHILYKGKPIKIFSHPHRHLNFENYYQNHKDVIRWSEQFNFDGLLCSTSAYDYFDNWVWAQYVCEHSQLSPFIALNPVYIHPFAAARRIYSLYKLYNRKIYINLISGSTHHDLAQINDDLNHEQRYNRLCEYYQAMQLLFMHRGPVSYEGKYYTLKQASLEGHFEVGFEPEFTVAGESIHAQQGASIMEIPLMQMLPSATEHFHTLNNKSIAFGIVIRNTNEEAWEAAQLLYPHDRLGQKLLKISLMGNQTEWKERLNQEMNQEDRSSDFPEYWLGPFKNKYADCPYLVGSFDRVKQILIQLFDEGIHSLVLTIKTEEEFNWISKLLKSIES